MQLKKKIKKINKIKKMAIQKPKMFINDSVVIESFVEYDRLFFKVKSNNLVLFISNDIEKTIKYAIDHCNRFNKAFTYNLNLEECDFEKLILAHLTYGLEKEKEYAVT